MVGPFTICKICKTVTCGSLTDMLVLTFIDLSMEHPWFRYAPDYNPLTVFLLYDGSMNLLPVKCVTTESVERDIAQAVNLFMKHAVCIYPKDQQVRVST